MDSFGGQYPICRVTCKQTMGRYWEKLTTETFSVLFADGLIVFKLIFSLDLYSQNWPCNSTRNAIPNFAQQNMTVLHYWSNADREDIQILCDVYTFLFIRIQKIFLNAFRGSSCFGIFLFLRIFLAYFKNILGLANF